MSFTLPALPRGGIRAWMRSRSGASQIVASPWGTIELCCTRERYDAANRMADRIALSPSEYEAIALWPETLEGVVALKRVFESTRLERVVKDDGRPFVAAIPPNAHRLGETWEG